MCSESSGCGVLVHFKADVRMYLLCSIKLILSIISIVHIYKTCQLTTTYISCLSIIYFLTDKDSRAASALTPSHTSPEQERQQYQQALRMLKNIDQKLSAGSGVPAAAEGGAGGIEAGRVAVPPAPVVGEYHCVSVCRMCTCLLVLCCVRKCLLLPLLLVHICGKHQLVRKCPIDNAAIMSITIFPSTCLLIVDLFLLCAQAKAQPPHTLPPMNTTLPRLIFRSPLPPQPPLAARKIATIRTASIAKTWKFSRIMTTSSLNPN